MFWFHSANLIQSLDQADGEGARWRLPRLFRRETDPGPEAETRLEHALTAAGELGMQGTQVEALVLRAHLFEVRGDAAAACGALSEAQTLAGTLDWLHLEQRVNAEMRRLGPRTGQ